MSSKTQKNPSIRFKGFTDAWEQRTLGELSEIVRGASPRPIQDPKWFDSNSDVGWLRISDVTAQNGRIYYLEQKISKVGQEKTRVLTEPHLLLSIAATVGKPVVNYVNTGVHDGFLIFLNPLFDREYMFQWLEMFRPKWQKYGQPGSQVNLNSELVRNQEIMIPSLKEQIQIGTFFKKLDDTIALHQQQLDNYIEFKKSVMKKIFSQELRLPGFYESWNVTCLKEIADPSDKYSFTGGPFGSDLKSEDYTAKGVRIIQLQNIGDGYFNDQYKIYTSNEKADELKSCNIYPGEIIISKMAAPLARAALIPDSDKRFLMASDGIRLKVNEQKHDKYFIYSYINNSIFRGKVEENSTGTTRKRIGLVTLGNLPLNIPDLDEQKLLSEFFQFLDKRIESQEKKISLLVEQKKGFMQQMFI